MALVGRFELIDRFAIGGMAELYRARDTRDRSPVVIKRLRPDKAEVPGVARAFKREINIHLALKHPNIVRAVDAGEVAGRDYLVMEHIKGPTLAEVRAGTVTDPVVQGALRVSRELNTMAPLWTKVPRQVLARLHVLAARDAVAPDRLGRPSGDPRIAARLSGLMELVGRGSVPVPGALLAAAIHGELLALSPFAGASGVVARAAARLTLIASGLDPRGLLPIEVGHLEREPEYQGVRQAFTTGTPDGLRAWLIHSANALTLAADELIAICDRSG